MTLCVTALYRISHGWLGIHLDTKDYLEHFIVALHITEQHIARIAHSTCHSGDVYCGTRQGDLRDIQWRDRCFIGVILVIFMVIFDRYSNQSLFTQIRIFIHFVKFPKVALFTGIVIVTGPWSPPGQPLPGDPGVDGLLAHQEGGVDVTHRGQVIVLHTLPNHLKWKWSI